MNQQSSQNTYNLKRTHTFYVIVIKQLISYLLIFKLIDTINHKSQIIENKIYTCQLSEFNIRIKLSLKPQNLATPIMHNSSVDRYSNKKLGKALTRELIFIKTRNDSLHGIKNLNLWGNDLEDLSLLNQMPNLEVISLSVNNIKTLQFFENCIKLQELYLRKNDIKVLNQVQYLMELPQLKVLWLCENPCANTKNYRQIVLQNLPNLIKLDNDVVSQVQKQKFNNQGQNSAAYEQIYVQRQNLSCIQPAQTKHQSNKAKTNNYLMQPQGNRSQMYQNSRSSPGRGQDVFSRERETPLKVVNNQSKVINHQMGQGSKSKRQQLVNRHQMQTPSSQRKTQKNVSSNLKQNPSRNPQQHRLSEHFSSIDNNGRSQIQLHQDYHSYAQQHHVGVHRQGASLMNKTASPNIIMAIMSLLDDLNEDGLQIIRKETQNKLIEARHQNRTKSIHQPNYNGHNRF